jgi:hypothetical protein
MALRVMTGSTCGPNTTIVFVADDALTAGQPTPRAYQFDTGLCVNITGISTATTVSAQTANIAFGPYTNCTTCTTPANSGGVTSRNCKDCDTGVFSSSTFNQAIYTNGQNRAIVQNNTVALGGFNGLNN